MAKSDTKFVYESYDVDMSYNTFKKKAKEKEKIPGFDEWAAAVAVVEEEGMV